MQTADWKVKWYCGVPAPWDDETAAAHGAQIASGQVQLEDRPPTTTAPEDDPTQ